MLAEVESILREVNEDTKLQKEEGSSRARARDCIHEYNKEAKSGEAQRAEKLLLSVRICKNLQGTTETLRNLPEHTRTLRRTRNTEGVVLYKEVE